MDEAALRLVKNSKKQRNVMMNVFIQEFPKQLKTALEIGRSAELTEYKKALHNIVVLGLGGSGIGGNFVAEFVQKNCPIPMISCKGYTLPQFVNEHSLVIASSFSGNTEETLIMFEAAVERGAKIVCISSGGKIIERAKALNIDYIQVPAVQQPPRTCLGYSLVQQLFVLQFFGLAPKTLIDNVERSIGLIEEHQERIKTIAKQYTRQLVGKFPMIYTTERMGAVALRFRQQLNENVKILASHHIVPEMNHNELVGWTPQEGDQAVIIFQSKDDHPRNLKRLEINKEIIGGVTDTILEIDCIGDSLVEQSLYAIHLGDWISYEWAIARGVDAVEVNVIDRLKGALAAAAL